MRSRVTGVYGTAPAPILLQPATPAPRQRRPALLFGLFALLVLFNVALPKGGLVFGAIPVTFGYMLIGMVGVLAVAGAIRVPPQLVAIAQLFFGFIPLGLITVFTSHGQVDAASQTIVYGTVFAVLPAIFLLGFSGFTERMTEQDMSLALLWAIRFAVAWGLLNFALFAVGHVFLRIPYLTVNSADLRDVFSRNNRRGVLMKLISTYNNGNIYGAVMVMLTPLYLLIEPRKLLRALFLLAIVLTLSRTAWAGLIAVILVMAAFGQVRLTRPAVWLMAGGAAMCISTLLPFIGWSSNMLVDQNLGGRLDQVTELAVTPFGMGRIHIPEILYVGLLQSFGVFGCLFAVTALGLPVAYGLTRASPPDGLARRALAGVIAYLLLSTSDSAIILAPVMPVFLFLCILSYRRGYAPAAAAAMRGPMPIFAPAVHRHGTLSPSG